MVRLTDKDSYRTPLSRVSPAAALMPSLVFHGRMLGLYYRSWRKARAGEYDDEAWVASSLEVVRFLESVGVRFLLDNLHVLHRLDTPCVFVANHMSTLETFVLPCVIHPHRRMVFIVKEALLKMPVFRHILSVRDPIGVGRQDPRKDLKTVLTGGAQRLAGGRSVLVFPQTTRSTMFDRARFNSMGVKLARKAGVPVVPIALKTDAWAVGRLAKDFGPIRPRIPVHMQFGEPLKVTGSGRDQHEEVVRFISQRLEDWGLETTAASNG